MIASHKGISRKPIHTPIISDGQCMFSSLVSSAEVRAGQKVDSRGGSSEGTRGESGDDKDRYRTRWKRRERPEVAPVATTALDIQAKILAVVGNEHEQTYS